MNAYQKFALDNHLSDYPVEDTFEEVVEKILDYSDDVLLWEPFFNEDVFDVVRNIEQMALDLERLFVPREGASLVAAAEREACERLAWDTPDDEETGIRSAIALAIRARGEA